jgi:hypothetical protein
MRLGLLLCAFGGGLALLLAACGSPGKGGAGGAGAGDGGHCPLKSWTPIECDTDADCNGLFCSDIDGPTSPSRCWTVQCATEADCVQQYAADCPGPGFYCLHAGTWKCLLRAQQPIGCPADACANGTSCCWDASTQAVGCGSCGSGSVDSIQCTTAYDCAAGTDCCLTATLGAGNYPACSVDHASSQCTAGCVTSLPTSCEAPATLHVCNATSDCADDAANPKCCNFGYGYYACVNQAIAGAPGVTCY